ncbi:DUF6674 family protein [Anaerorhabdus sp.]|uniref:DUF6674 family protein n=1 Tax=Anaerorhabdus sp. TaxID=1872524 RepID=UPI002FCB9B54
MEDRQTLLEQNNMKKFLQLLEENGMKEQKQEVEFLAGYIDQMDFQFTNVLDELKNVRQELNVIQDKTLRATALRAVDKVTNKVEVAKGTLVKLKEHVISTVDKAVINFKEHGKSALVTAMKSLNVKGMLESIHGTLQHVIKSADHEIDNLTKLGNEIHAVNFHMKNIGKTIMGKDTQEPTSRRSDSGLLSKVQESLFFSMKACATMSQKTESILVKIKDVEEKHEKKSVRNDLKEIKDKHKVGNQAKEITRKDMELGQR